MLEVDETLFTAEVRFSRNAKYFLAYCRGETARWIRIWDLETMEIYPETLRSSQFRYEILPTDRYSAIINELIFTWPEAKIGNIITGDWIEIQASVGKALPCIS